MKKFYCNNCNAEVSEDANYCPNCGYYFDDELDYQENESSDFQNNYSSYFTPENKTLLKLDINHNIYNITYSNLINLDFNFDIKNPRFTCSFYNGGEILVATYPLYSFAKLNEFLSINKGLIYKPLSKNNFMIFISCLTSKNTNNQLLPLISKEYASSFKNKVKKLLEMFANYGVQLLNTPTSYSKSLDPFIAAGIANGIAGVGAAVLVGAQQAAKQVQVEQYNSWVSTELSKLNVAQNSLFKAYNEIEQIIFQSKESATMWESLKYNAYENRVQTFISDYQRVEFEKKRNSSTIFPVLLMIILSSFAAFFVSEMFDSDGLGILMCFVTLIVGMFLISKRYYGK